MPKLPAVTGRQLIRLLERDGWEIKRRARHGLAMAKEFPERKRVTVVPDKTDPLPRGTLKDILGPDQTGLGRRGLEELIKRHGLK